MCEYINGTIIQEDFTMEKTKYDENNGLWYELRSDYYIPCLAVPAQEERPIGIWGRRGAIPAVFISAPRICINHTNSIKSYDILVLAVSSVCIICQV